MDFPSRLKFQKGSKLRAAPGGPVLVVKNHDGFWSFGELNHDTKPYEAVSYGSGEAFIKRQCRLLARFYVRCMRLERFILGICSPKALHILSDFNRKAAPSEPKLEPALDLYRRLLRNGRRREKEERVSGDSAMARIWAW